MLLTQKKFMIGHAGTTSSGSNAACASQCALSVLSGARRACACRRRRMRVLLHAPRLLGERPARARRRHRMRVPLHAPRSPGARLARACRRRRMRVLLHSRGCHGHAPRAPVAVT
eukprot:4776367-Pleurochrysis_carterae.AAC.3